MKIIIIGGGAAGFFAAIRAAGQDAEVILLEKSNKILAKVKVSGGGRCNVTNSCTDPKLLATYYPRGGKELVSAFTVFGPIQTMEWFSQRGVRLKTEPDGRMFPVTDSSQTIIDCLTNEVVKSGVKLRFNSAVESIEFLNPGFLINLPGNEKLVADRLIIATGGHPNLKNYDWLKNMGHSIIPPVPSLFTFNLTGNIFDDLMGVALHDVIVRIRGTKFLQQGALLFTHWGISGPAVLKLSAWAARWLSEVQYDFTAVINFFPDSHEERIKTELQEEVKTHPLRRVSGQGFKNIPVRLWTRLCAIAGIGNDMKWSEAGKKSLNKLAALLTGLELPVKGKTTFKEEFVTCGGIKLNEINMRTMESKMVPGLFFAGEVMDIDGVTGGFNFQAAWTTGFIAGEHCNRK